MTLCPKSQVFRASVVSPPAGKNGDTGNSVRHGICDDVFCIRKNGISPQGCGSDCKF